MSLQNIKVFLTEIRRRLELAGPSINEGRSDPSRSSINMDRIEDILGGVIGVIDDYETRLPTYIQSYQDPEAEDDVASVYDRSDEPRGSFR